MANNEKLTNLAALRLLAKRTDERLDALETVGAQANVIESVSVNGTPQTVTNKNVDIPVPEYSITSDTDSGTYAAVYHLTKGGVNTGVAINIPKDLVVKSGSVETFTDANKPKGVAHAGTYIKLVLQNATDPLYIDVGSLIEYVTSGSQATDMVVITVDGTTHQVTASITDGSITADKLHTDVQTALGKIHEHDNKTLLDSYTQTEANLADAVSKKHVHGNGTVLDGITAEKVTSWDGKQDALTFATDDEVTQMLNEVYGAPTN